MPARPTRGGLAALVVALLAAVASACLLEGLAGFWLLLRGFHRPVAERLHTRYDAELGWVNRRGVFLKDLYGPGKSLALNSLGTRNREEFSSAIAPGKRRVICSGDSFTFGYGVSNDEAWCNQLAASDPSLEAVNMGQGGYGIDQSYLWYLREGARIPHDLHVFAFTSDDFERMGSTAFEGYGKPVLILAGGELQVRNVPVPRGAYAWPWLTENLEGLRSLNLARLFEPRRPRRAPSPSNVALALGVFQDLYRRDRAAGVRLLLVYLPTRREALNGAGSFQRYLARRMKERAIPFLDLTPDFARRPSDDISSLFIADSPFPGGEGHYTAEGNRLVAERVGAAIRALRPR